MTRLPDWHARLVALIEMRKTEPFSWGVNDCCLWAADAVMAMTGHDPAAGIRGTYSTARGAALALRRIGGMAGAGARCGAEIPPLCAQVGDVGIVSSDDSPRESGAVCIGEHWLVVVKRGLGLVELHAARKAWRVA
jgi:hypothetical protein